MPGVEVIKPTDSSDRPLFKSHKHLPRKGIVVPDIDLVRPVSPNQNLTVATPAPPLTPPRVSQEDAIDTELPPRKLPSRSEQQTEGVMTPRRPSKPPTPDVTPPRTNSIKRPPLGHSAQHSASSRAESFQTARESIYSDGDMETPIRSARNKSRKHKPTVQSSRPYATPAPATQLTYTKDAYPFDFRHPSDAEHDSGIATVDSGWLPKQVDGSPTPLPGKRRRSKPTKQTNAVKDPNTNSLDVNRLDATLAREKTIREQESPEAPSMERAREEIGWPTFDGLSQTDDTESHRLSGLSSTSTVEAMIIDSPKRAQRLLRHTEKRSSLRSASSPVTKSPASIASNPSSQHRLAHKAARISEQDRRSISSGVPFSTNTSANTPHASIDIIPVVVVPERRSSLKSGPNSYASSKPDSQRSSRRPPVSSQGSGSIHVSRQRKRTMSESASAKSRDTDSRSRSLVRPVIPPRSSSLSAPTSRNNSRAASLTSASLHSHNMAMDFTTQKAGNQESVSPPRHEILTLDTEAPDVNDQQPVSPPRHNILAHTATFDRPVSKPSVKVEDTSRGQSLIETPRMPGLISSEDLATLRPPSLPFTQWSIPSSSPGPIEIGEATALSLFAHNNRSLLLIDQRVPPPSRLLPPVPQTWSFRAFHEASQPLSEPRTPEIPSEPATDKFMSPLRNPRTPPEPPSSKPLPPIPTQETTLERNPSKAKSQPVSRRPSIRRPWGGRPRSNSFTTVARSLSIRSAKNRKVGLEMDSQEHPFWRPRGFWDGISTSPTKGNSARQSLQTPEEGIIINNAFGLPQQRITVEGPPAIARRSPEMRRLLHGMSSASHLNTSHASLVDQAILRTGSPLYQNRFRVISRLGLRFQSLSLRGMRSRVRRIRQRRDERKRAARRENLKQSIGGPVYVGSSATNGVMR